MEARIEALLAQFHTIFGDREARVWSAPGRTEIGGNHTDHQLGKVLAASVDMDMLAAAAINGENTVRIQSEGYDMFTLSLDTLTPVKAEEGEICSPLAFPLKPRPLAFPLRGRWSAPISREGRDG